jgi:magnesium-transporting ATPase (P-type)
LCGVWMMAGTLALFWYTYSVLGEPMLKAQTVAFCTLAFFQIWNVQNSRSLDRSLLFPLPGKRAGEWINRIAFTDNLPLCMVMLLSMLLQILAVELPLLDVMLDTPFALNTGDWLRIAGMSFSIIVLVEVEKITLAVWKRFVR